MKKRLLACEVVHVDAFGVVPPSTSSLGHSKWTRAAAQAEMRELPSQKRARFGALGLSTYDVLLLTDDVATAAYFDAALAAGAPAKLATNWILSDLSAHCNVSRFPVPLLGNATGVPTPTA